MRKIKFRGTAATDGRIVYGDGAYVTADFECVVERMIYVHCKPDSVSQLIGLDKNGREVYEGDAASYEGREFIATLGNVDDIELCELVRCGYEED